MHYFNKFKTAMLLVAAVLVVGFAFADKVTKTILEGKTFSDYMVDEAIELTSADLKTVKAGDVLKVYVAGIAYDAEARSEAPMRALKASGKFAILADDNMVEESPEYKTTDAFPVVAEITLDEAKAAQLQNASAIYLRGRNLIISKIELETEEAEPVNRVLDDGKYFLVNTASQKWWGAGNSWGTQASLVNHPEYVTLTMQEDGTYTLESQVSNGGTQYYFDGDYMDKGTPMPLTITELGEQQMTDQGVALKTYTISNNGNFFGYDGSTTVLGKNLAAGDINAIWVIIPESLALPALKMATKDNPIDATWLILDPNFGRNNRNQDAWVVSEDCTNKNLSGGNNTNNNAESYHSTFTISQTLANAPKGIYKMTAQGFYRQDGSDNENLPVFFANDVTKTFPVKTGSENSMSDASASFTNGLYAIDPIYVEVTEDGALTIGTKLEVNTGLWCIWDNFELLYYGADCTLDDVTGGAASQELQELIAKAEELLGQVDNDNVKAALNSAIANASTTDVDTAIAALKEAIDKAEANIMAKNVLPQMAELVASTNVYTEEALNEYYTQWQVKYTDGSLTKAEAATLQDPFLVTGWHANTTVDNFLLSAWDTNPDFVDAPYYINSWSVEGDNDGSNFRVPFFEYWTVDDQSLGERTLTATMNNLPEGQYSVTAWVRVRIKNGAEAPAYGISLQANDGEAVDVAAGEQVGSSQFYLKEYTATGAVAADGVLLIKFIVAADNNISWLSFKNVKFEKTGEVGPEPQEPQYKVNEVVEDQIVRTTTGTAELGTTVKVPYRHYNVIDGKLYSKGATSKEYNYSFTFNADGQEENITGYSATGTQDIVFLSEGEDIEGMTVINTGNAAIRSSNSAAGYPADSDVEIVKLPAGTYKLTAAIYDSAKNPDSHWIFKAGEEQIADLNCTAVNYQELTSEKFTLTEETSIYLAQGGTSSRGLDLVYIQAVEAETPIFAYTVNEVVNGAAVRTTIGSAEKASVVKVPFREYNCVDGKLYKKAQINKEFNYSFTLNEDNQVEDLEYAETGVEDVVFLSEGEDIPGMEVISTGNASIRSSNSAAGYAKDADVVITTLPAGTYKIVATIYDASKTPDSHWFFKAGEEQVADLNCTVVNIQELTSEEFTLSAETPISMAQGGASNMGLDVIYIVKVTAEGISTISAEAAQGTVYNLNGQKVMKATKGLYIINGKKVVLK